MYSRANIKINAKILLEGKIGFFFIAALIVSVCSMVSTVPYVGTVAYVILCPPIAYGYQFMYYNVVHNVENNYDDIFVAFKIKSLFGRALSGYWLTLLFTFLWSLLFIIPGIIKTYSYSMVPYIIFREQNITASDAIKLSKKMMKGNKGKLFCLHLSFLGWTLLGALTLGILFIYVTPYMNISYSLFYKQIYDNYYITAQE